uniref:Sulfatase N-terminal domain-containing protein n=1 Tax=Anopheles epiroticus TaxID=199890 RepID=A0A182PNF9_9DIPT
MEPSTLPSEFLDEIDMIQRKRWQTLMAVDEMVENIVSVLAERQLLDNTFIFYTSDNGFHLGQFSQAYDKRQPYETDIRVPLFVRGPTIPPKSVQASAVALLDIVPTILQLAKLELPFSLDGQPLPLHSDPEVVIERQILIEYWGEGSLETHNPDCPWSAQDRLQLCTVDAACHCQDAWNNTYNCIRHLALDLDFIYCEFKDNQLFVEAYNIANDPYEMNNIAYEILPSVRAKYSLGLQNLTANWFGGGVSPLPDPSRHMNTSLARVDFLGVVGTPCKNLDSSSNVTIFSRGFGVASMVELAACCVIRLRFAGGSARSPTPDRLNSLTLRGTKYSI